MALGERRVAQGGGRWVVWVVVVVVVVVVGVGVGVGVGAGVGVGWGGVRVESPAVERTVLRIDLDLAYNVAGSQERCERRRAAAFVSHNQYLEPNIMAGRMHCVRAYI